MVLALGTIMCVSVAGFAWKLGGRSRVSVAGSQTASVSRELAKLDPFTFFVLPGLEYGVHHVVIGTTGAFAIQVGHETVDGKFRQDVSQARRAAARIRRSAGSAAVHARVTPIVCLPGRQFGAKTSRGVRVIPWGRVVAEVAERRRTVTPHQARRFAEALGALDPTPGIRETV